MLQKIQTQEQEPIKSCFGTKEWSNTSGICKACKLKSECQKRKIGEK